MSMSNRAAVASAGLVCLAGFVLVILSASLAEAEYGPRTAIGANYQQTSTTESENGIDQASCIGTTRCFVLFQQVPKEWPLIIQHVSCLVYVSSASGGDVPYGTIETRRRKTFLLRQTFLVPLRRSDFLWVVNSPAMHLLKAGERAVVSFFSSANAGFNPVCTISGRLLQP